MAICKHGDVQNLPWLNNMLEKGGINVGQKNITERVEAAGSTESGGPFYSHE